VNRGTRDTPFNLVYGVDAVLPLEIYLESARVTHFDSILIEERCNTILINIWKYQESLKKYYNKNVVQRELHFGDLVVKDFRTRDKHKSLSP
jgi:hypothetical protein